MSFQAIGDRRVLERLPGGGYAYTMLDEAVRVEVRYVRREYHQLHAEVDVLCDWADVRRHNHSLSRGDLNLSSQATRRALAKHCAERAKTSPDAFDWLGVIDATCLEVIAAERQGESPIVLDDAPVRDDRDFNIDGLQVPADAASMLIAHGDSLKSMILLYILGRMAREGRHVLYVDWEWSPDRHRQRKQRLFGADRLDTLHYLRCRAALTIEADRIRRFCDEQHVEFIACDSVGLACDGKLADDDTAIRFHRALATLPPSLSAAHVPKGSIGPDAKGDPIGPFGSVFFSNLCRTTWVVKKQHSASDDVVTVGLLPQKQNDGARRPAVGFEFTFSDDQINVRNVDLAAVEGLAEKLPLPARMAHALKRGPMTFAELASTLDAKVDSVIKASKRSNAFMKLPGQDGVYRLALVERRIA